MEALIEIPPGPTRLATTGAGERHLKSIRDRLGVQITARANVIRIRGGDNAVTHASALIEQIHDAARDNRPVTDDQFNLLLDEIDHLIANPNAHPADASSPRLPSAAGLDVYLRGRTIRPKTAGQRDYLSAILDHDLTFCLGPAGTGKTYLAVAAAVCLLKREHARKIMLVRPAVEAGEKLGFLPGDLQQKVNPYLRPLLDALHDCMEYEQVQRFLATDIVEIVPLAFMRGRTLNDAVVILDEAQNTTRSQMLMFLTRLGHGSRMVVTGDTSQTDLDNPNDSGLIDAARRLRRTPGIAWVTLGKQDIVRHSLVQRIVQAYQPPTPHSPASPA